MSCKHSESNTVYHSCFVFVVVSAYKLDTFTSNDEYKVIISNVVNSCSSVLLLYFFFVYHVVYVAF